jgi:hypothetical protein
MLTTFPPGTLKGPQHDIYYLTIFLRKSSAQNVPTVGTESENTHFNVQTISEPHRFQMSIMEKKIKYILVAGEASTPSSGSMASSQTISPGNPHPTFTYTLHNTFFIDTQAYHDIFVYVQYGKKPCIYIVYILKFFYCLYVHLCRYL